MSLATHYSALNILESAPPNLIRAAFKALSNDYHPDKTQHLSADERAERAAKFREIQEAYDILSNSSEKAWYDDELAKGDLTSFRPCTPQFLRRTTSSASIHHRRASIITTPSEKAAMKAKAHMVLKSIREDRAKRDVEEQEMSVTDLKFNLGLWKDLAEECRDNPMERAQCAIKVFEYEEKLRQRAAEREDWLSNMAKCKTQPGLCTRHDYDNVRSPTPSTPKTRSRKLSNASRSTSSVCGASSKTKLSVLEQRKLAAEKRAVEDAARAAARAEEAARKQAAKQAHIEAKASAARAMKEQQKRKADALAKKQADQIAKARAKSAPTVIGKAVAPSDDHYDCLDDTLDILSIQNRKKECARCGDAHSSLREWKKCTMESANNGVDTAFFQVV